MTSKQKTLKLIKPESLAVVKNISKSRLTLLTCYQKGGNNFFLLELILNSASKKFKNQINFFFCPIKHKEELQLLKVEVENFPVTLLLKDEKVQDYFWGILPKHKIIDKIETQLQKSA